MSEKAIALQMFDAFNLHQRLETKTDEALLKSCGIDPEKPQDWPMGHITYDWYDLSFEFKQTQPD